VYLAAGTLQVTTSPALSPAFDPGITDYVVPYKPGSPVQLVVDAPTSTRVSVASQTLGALRSTTQVNLTPGQSFSFVVNSPGSSKTYYVRCLPTDFPTWTTERPGTPQSEYYIIAPDLYLTAGASGSYAIITDNYGVPLWWYHSSGVPVDTTLLPNGNIAWVGNPTGEEHKLDGSRVRTFTPATSPGGTLDVHELLLLPNGDYLFIADVQRKPVDLSPYGGSATATVVDNVIEEVTPNGALVWQWSAMDHIPVAETDPLWRTAVLVNESPADPYHMNSVEVNGNGFVLSFRHLNAVYFIDKASGNILKKLGGTSRPESLAFNGDTYGNFGGQHDARVLSDGTLTLHDDGTLLGRAPRAVHYSVDMSAKTATLIEQVTDPDVSSSGCCGSARKLLGGDWVMSWGQNRYVTELASTGKRVFRLTFAATYYSYRAVPVPVGVLSREALRKGMDTQFPR
jgi:hypothetical protein